MRDDHFVFKWSFSGATESDLSGSDYYEEFGVAKRGTTQSSTTRHWQMALAGGSWPRSVSVPRWRWTRKGH